MKNLSLFLLFFCLSLSLIAQTEADKNAIANAKWEKTKIGKGLTWQHFHFSEKQLFQSNQNIHFLKMRFHKKKKRQNDPQK